MLDKKKVGKTIALYRKKKEMTQKELAEMLHVSYQAVSRRELGVSLPTVEMIYDIAAVLDVTIDFLLNGTILENRDICYKDTGLDTAKMKEPVYAMNTNVPGSKARFARQQGYDKEICADIVAKAINGMVCFGIKPVTVKAHIVCGNKDYEQLWAMAKTLKDACESNDVLFAGVEIAAQPINYLPNEYELSLGISGVADKEKIITGQRIGEGDVLIGMMTEGLESVCFPFIRVMLDRNPELAYAKIDGKQYFMEEILKPCAAYAKAVYELTEAGVVDGMFQVGNSILNQWIYGRLPDGLGACIHMENIPIMPLYRFMAGLDMVGKTFFPYRFSFGIGMIAVVPEQKKQQAMQIISKYHQCCVIGRIKKVKGHTNEKVWKEGKVRW